jgi:hypothetical protein
MDAVERLTGLFRMERMVHLAVTCVSLIILLSIQADPSYGWGYFDLARFLCAASPPRIEEAKEAARRAVELRADMPEVMQRDAEFRRLCGGKVP